MAFATNASGACAPQPTGLAHWWPMDWETGDKVGSVPDIIGNATATDEAGFIPVAGYVCQAFPFTDRATTFHTLTSTLAGAEFSFVAWVNPVANASGQLLSFDSFAALGIHQGQLAAYICDDHVCWAFEQTGIFLASGTWTLVAATFSFNDHTARLYVNGSQQFSTGAVLGGSTFLFTSGRWLIGEQDPAGAGIGTIDEVQVYTTALSQATLTALYQAGHDGVCPPPGYSCEPPMSAVAMPVLGRPGWAVLAFLLCCAVVVATARFKPPRSRAGADGEASA